MGQKLLWLAISGALATVSRYLLAGFIQRIVASLFPWGTLGVNGLGCFLFGIVSAITSERFAVGSETRTIILVGFLGAFTTLSTAIAEFGQLAMDGAWLRAAAYLVGSNAAGISAFLAGLALGRMI